MSNNGNDRRRTTDKTRVPRKNSAQSGSGRAQQTNSGSRTRSKRNKKGKSQYMAFYIVTLIVAVIVCLATFAFVLSQVSNNRANANTNTERPNTEVTQPPTRPENNPPEENPPVIAIEEIGLTGVIVSVNQVGRTLEILDIDSQTILNFRSDNSTTIQNRAGENMSFAQIRPGDIVDARYRDINAPLTSVSLAANAWEHRNVDGVIVNPQGRSITISGNPNIYRYNEHTISLFENNPYNIANINPQNAVTMRGVGSDVWFIEVGRGTGFINVLNGENIVGCVIDVGDGATANLNESGTTAEPIRVQAGTRHIFVRGTNIHDFNTTIDVSTGEQAILDLSAVQFLSGAVSFIINEPGATVTLNGTVRRTDEPLILDYGTYELVVTKEGFVTHEATFELNQPSLEISVRLERDVSLVSLVIVTSNAATGAPLTGARIYVDDIFVGLSPINALVEEGNRTLSIRKEGFVNLNFVTDGRPRYDIALQELADSSGVHVPSVPPLIP